MQPGASFGVQVGCKFGGAILAVQFFDGLGFLRGEIFRSQISDFEVGVFRTVLVFGFPQENFADSVLKSRVIPQVHTTNND